MNMFRSAALLSPIAYLNQISSLLARAAVDIFLAEVVNFFELFLAKSEPHFSVLLNKFIFLFFFPLLNRTSTG